MRPVGAVSPTRRARRLTLEPLELRAMMSLPGITPAVPEYGLFTGDDQTQSAVFRFTFDKLPQLSSLDGGFSAVSLDGAETWFSPGDPIVPVRPSTILLPPGMQVQSVSVAYLDAGVSLGSGVLLAAAPADGQLDPTEELASFVTSDFACQEPVTFSNSSLAGYRLGSLRVFPVQYEADSGTLTFHRDIAVTVTAAADASSAWAGPRPLASDWERVAGLVDNPESLAAYNTITALPLADGEGASPLANYEYVIITSSALESSFQPLLNQKLSRGLSGAIFTTEYIYANYSGTENHDNADKIRGFIRDSYLNHGTQWVLLGGDVEVIPTRGVYASNAWATETSLPTDMYYACLDGPWNGNGNSYWGESSDGAGGGDIDLGAEVYVGRAPVSNTTEVDNFVSKTILYETTAPPNPQTAVFLGEKLDYRTYGSSSCINIRDSVLPVDWLPELVERYDTSSYSYSGMDVLNDLNASPHIVESLGHASTSTESRITSIDVAGLTNAFPYFMYSQGCDAGAFDLADVSIAEQHVVSAHGAFAVVMNARKGWFVSGSTPGYSHWYAKEFWDAVFTEGKLHLGEANQDSRDDNLWRLGIDNTYRWIHFETNLFGDPETSFKLDTPPANQPPVAVNDAYTTNEDTALTVVASGVLANDTDFEGSALTAALVAGPGHGTLTLNTNGSFTYTPTANYFGPDSFTYRASDGTASSNIATVSLTVNSVNDAPLAANDAYTTNEDTALTITAPGLLANDNDPEGSPLTAAVVAGPSHGVLTLNTNGSFTYTPAANYFGPDSFTYRASDGTTSSNIATVNLTVNPINDAPLAANDAYTTNEDTALTVAAAGVLSNDTDPEGSPLTAVLVAGPSHGTLTLNTNGSFTYTPAANYFGADSFTYRASDGTASSNIATVNLTVNPINDAPVAANDSYATNEDTALTVAAPGLLANDTDPEGSPLTAALVAGPSHGTLTLNTNGSFTYTPAANYYGSDSFTYRDSDGTASSNIATVSLTVNRVHLNQPPVLAHIGDQTISHHQQTLTLNLAATDADGDPLSYSATVLPADPLAQQAYQLDQQLQLSYLPGIDNLHGAQEKWLLAANGQLYALLPSGELRRWVGMMNLSPVVACLSPAYHANPQLLCDAQPPLGSSDVTLSLQGSQLLIQPRAGALGTFRVQAAVSDGQQTATEVFRVCVTNSAPVLAPIADQTISHRQQTLTLNLAATDADGDPLSYSASVLPADPLAQQAYQLDQQLQLSYLSHIDNLHGMQEKWLLAANGQLYALLPSGEVRHWVGLMNVSPVVARLSPAYYANPQLLCDAQPPLGSSDVTLSFQGSQLTIQPRAGALGTCQIQVGVSDGLQAAAQVFRVCVTNVAPVLAPIADQTISHRQQTLTLNLTATDADGDPLSYSAGVLPADPLAQQAYQLDQQLQLSYLPNLDNLHGAQEKWLLAANGQLYALLPSGEVRHWVGMMNISPVVARLSPAYYANPQLLCDAPPPLGSSDVTLSFQGSQLTIQPRAGALGTCQIQVGVSDGVQTAAQVFRMCVTNVAPVLAPMADQTIAPPQQTVTLNLAATDADGDPLGYSATVLPADPLAQQAYQLDQQLQLSYLPNLDNLHGAQEKWLLAGNGQLYALLPSGEVRRWVGMMNLSPAVARLSPAYYATPQLLCDAPPPLGSSDVTLSFQGSQLTIQPRAGALGTCQIQVAVSDGACTTTATFRLQVTGPGAAAASLGTAGALADPPCSLGSPGAAGSEAAAGVLAAERSVTGDPRAAAANFPQMVDQVYTRWDSGRTSLLEIDFLAALHSAASTPERPPGGRR